MKKLNSRHRAIMADCIAGLTAVQISAKYDVREATLRILRKSPIWIREERELRQPVVEAAQTRMTSLAEDAIDVYADLVKPGTLINEGTPNEVYVTNKPELRLTAARDIAKSIGILGDSKVQIAAEGSVVVKIDA